MKQKFINLFRDMGIFNSEMAEDHSIEKQLNEAYDKGIDHAKKIVEQYCFETAQGRMAHVGMILHTASEQILAKLEKLKTKDPVNPI